MQPLKTQADRAQLIQRLGRSHENPIKKRNHGSEAPLSYSQERLWIMSQLEPDNPLYNVAGAVRFEGSLNQPALKQSLDEVIRRHELLRSRFVRENHQALQKVLPGETLNWICLDFSAFEAGRAMELFQALAEDIIRRPFRLELEAPLRVFWVSVDKNNHVLMLSLHHMVSDRWSIGILMKEIAALYQAFSSGKPSLLPELQIQYGDFCIWQRQQDQPLDYWRHKLAGVPPFLALPGDRPRPSLQSYRGDSCCFEWSETLTHELKSFCRQQNATLFMLMAAGLSSLFYRYTGSDDFCIGYPTAGRAQSQTADLIGFFVNTLVLRCKLDGDLSFAAWLKQLREQALQDQVHQDVSFGQLLDALNCPRNASHAPLFQVMLTVQNAPAADFKLPGLNVASLPLDNKISQFDLTFLVEERHGKLFVAIEYNADLFDAATIFRMAGHLNSLLQGILADPSIELKHLPLLTPEEHRQLIDEWSGREACMPKQALIHDLFAEQARLNPDKTALVFAEQRLSYGELNRRATLWADHLVCSGIGPECRVGVCLERSIDLVVALLAVLKSGAAYVPLDPGYPEERLEFMAEDAQIALLLTDSRLKPFRHSKIAKFLLNVEPEAVTHSIKPLISPENTAYIIYTSGSTGRPKGVSISHGNLSHSTWARSLYYREPLDCFLLVSSFAFDSSVAGLFWTLSQGGCLCLPKPHESADPSALARLIRKQGVSHLLALPSFYALILDEKPDTLKTVIVAGEACSGEIAAKHHLKLPEASLYNEYGPTEGTVWSSVFQSRPGLKGGGLSIGRPIDNARIYILDKQCRPVAVGVGGELHIGGPGLAQGYLNQPRLTAEKFIPNPFGREGGRLYKTGDLARFRMDGQIEFMGRMDHQVKIRGYRIELGEIEARLRLHPAIEDAVVLVNENSRLQAYVTIRSELPENDVLQAYLKQSLPDYMIPSAYRVLDSFPSTPNGKCDRQALSSMNEPAQTPSVLKQPGNWIEKALLAIWQEVLGLENISVDADFFALGGHSLAAIQVNSRIQRDLNVELPLDRLFELTRIEALASEIVRLTAIQSDDDFLDDLLKELA